ncbi:MAG: hypothetical protein ABIL09_16225, partial [Gemmatimonadota bacterium]
MSGSPAPRRPALRAAAALAIGIGLAMALAPPPAVPLALAAILYLAAAGRAVRGPAGGRLAGALLLAAVAALG